MVVVRSRSSVWRSLSPVIVPAVKTGAHKMLNTSSAPEDQDTSVYRYIGVTSPLMATESVPMTSVMSGLEMSKTKPGDWLFVASYFGVTTVATLVLFSLTALLLRSRWRLTGRG